jgi:hypothetical protein
MPFHAKGFWGRSPTVRVPSGTMPDGILSTICGALALVNLTGRMWPFRLAKRETKIRGRELGRRIGG